MDAFQVTTEISLEHQYAASSTNGDFLDQESTELFLMVCIGVIQPVTGLFLIVSNSVNLSLFFKLGLRDPVTMTLFALAIADLAYSVAAVMLGVCITLGMIPQTRYYVVDFSALGMLVIWYMEMFTGWSLLFTTYLAVVKCFCVAKPLHFMNTCTRKRTNMGISIICLVGSGFYIPMFCLESLKWRHDPLTNSSRLMIWSAEERESMLKITVYFNRNILPNSAMVLNLLCLVILANSLRKASRFRNSLSKQKSQGSEEIATRDGVGANLNATLRNNEIEMRKCDQIHEDKENRLVEKCQTGMIKKPEYTGHTGKKNKMKEAKPDATGKMAARDIQVIKVVALVSALFVASHLPDVVISIARTVEPEFNALKKYNYLFNSVNMIASIVPNLCSSANIFIYYGYNTKYRQLFRETFGCK